MSRLLVSDTVVQAYKGGLQDLINYGFYAPPVLDPKSPASRFGEKPRNAIEIIGYTHEISNPLHTLLSSKIRPVDPFYLAGLAVWFLAGSNSLEWLSFYNKHALYYSNDGQTLCGSFGYRLRYGQLGTDQIECVIKRILNDAGTRRAVATIFFEEDNLHETREFPCALGSHFFLRDNRLHAITYMRAQQALTIFPYDIFIFITLQSYIATRIGVKIGSYYHFCGTYHIYEDEIKMASEISQETITGFPIGIFDEENAPIKTLLYLEEKVRTAVSANNIREIKALTCNPFPAGTFASDIYQVVIVRAFQLLGQHDEALILANNCSEWFHDAIKNYLRGK